MIRPSLFWEDPPPRLPLWPVGHQPFASTCHIGYDGQIKQTSKNSKPDAVDDEVVLQEYREAVNGWHSALEAHRMAPPDADFSTRLANLAEAAGEQARVCRAVAAEYEWPQRDAPPGKPPYELRADTGRRGPQDLWRRFDDTVEQLNATTRSDDMLAVASAYEDLAVAAADLAKAVKREDRSSATRSRTRARRTA